VVSRTAHATDEQQAVAAAMCAYQAGEAGAFDKLYVGLAPILRRYLRGAVRNDARVEDLLQETFLQIHRARRTYNPDRPLVPWVLAIARHVFLMDCRTRRRKRESETVEVDESLAGSAPGQDHAVVARDEVRQALSVLTPTTRKALLLHHVQGWSFREIGARLGINSAAAKLRASRGMHALRTRLGERRRDDDEQ
jgi:RNA polymerase sigma-70 factor (ECF subfamily)